MSPARQRIPSHLTPFVVEQDYSRYTAEDQAVWRYIMRQLKDFLAKNAHECYVEGLAKTGISDDQIPRIDEMDRKLSEFDWGAVPVSGFIPPAAFMEFQSLGILPIASDMRSLDHIGYTPAPDIVHEAAGHGPILINPEFASYLKRYAEVARNAIVSRADMRQYAAIRALSDVKENPQSSPEQIRQAEDDLRAVNESLTFVSEAGWLSRMNWWTAEYGLIGDLKNPKIYGAGLLSSVSESRACLSPKVKKIPLDIGCLEVGYDITEPQPQLFVTPSFDHLNEVLEQLARKMAFRLGGVQGLQRAQSAQTVVTVELDSGLQISGAVESFQSQKEWVDFLKFRGPVALAYDNRELPDHGRENHAHGFSSPLGRLQGFDRPLTAASDGDLAELGIIKGRQVHLQFNSGIEIEGRVANWRRNKHHLILIQFENAKVYLDDEILFDPSWGKFDMAVGEKVIGVRGGAADRIAYGETESFPAARVPTRVLSEATIRRCEFHSDLRRMRQGPQDADQQWLGLRERYFKDLSGHWLPALELIELAHLLELGAFKSEIEELMFHLKRLGAQSPSVAQCVNDGLKLANKK